MDIIEKRKVAYKDNILKEAVGDIENKEHTLRLRKENRKYIISLNDKNARISTKSFLTKSMSENYFSKLVNQHGFSVVTNETQTRAGNNKNIKK